MSKKVKVKFADPPPPRRDYGWEDIAKQLRSRPNEWAVVHENLPASVAGAVARGKIAPVKPTAGFESKTAGNTRPDGGPRMTGQLFLRYCPERDQTSRKK